MFTVNNNEGREGQYWGVAAMIEANDVPANYTPLGTGGRPMYRNSDVDAPNTVMRRQKDQKRERARKL